MIRSVKQNQSRPREIVLAVNGTTGGTGPDSITIGKYEATYLDNGTGSYTLTFKVPFKRTPVVSGLTFQTSVSSGYVSAVSTTAITILTFAMDGTTAKDTIFGLVVKGWDNQDEFNAPSITG